MEKGFALALVSDEYSTLKGITPAYMHNLGMAL